MTYTELIERLRNDIALMPVSAIAREFADAIEALQAEVNAANSACESAIKRAEAMEAERNALQAEVSELQSWKEAARDKLDWQQTDNRLLRVQLETNEAANKTRIAALQSQLDTMGKGEPIYQYQMGDGRWIDQTKHSYDYNRNHAPNAVVRIVYATPKALAPLTDEQILEAIRNAPKMQTTYAGWVRDQRIAWGRAILAATHGIGGTP